MTFTIESEQEADGRWLAEITELPGVMVYGETPEDAMTKVHALALRVIADRLEHGERVISTSGRNPVSGWLAKRDSRAAR